MQCNVPNNFGLNTNLTYSKLDKKNQNDGLEDGFNTPKWVLNIAICNPKIYNNIGFTIGLRHQNAFLWQSALATGIVPAYTTIDCQINTPVFLIKQL